MKIKNVFSAFDGASCGQISLNDVGIEYENYYSSEIEKKAIEITQHNFPNTIQVGDIKDVDGLRYESDIDLMIGGPPCQSLSFAGKMNGMSTIDNIEVTSLDQYTKLKEEGFKFEGQSYLFWEYVRLFEEIKPKYFLLENVVMLKKWEDIITKTLGVQPVLINSSFFSAQNRERLYWTNIPVAELPKAPSPLCIKDVLYDNSYGVFHNPPELEVTKKITRSRTIEWLVNGNRSQQNRAYFMEGKFPTLPRSTNPTDKMNICLDYDKGIYRKIHPIEAERAQTLPDDYTNIPNITTIQRLQAIGNGWTVKVISHILNGLK